MPSPASDYGPIYQAAGKQYNVDPRLLQAVIATESNGDPNAVSSAGAVGPAQLMPATAQSLGVTNPRDPTQAIYGAAELLDQNLKRYGSPDKAILAYHGGTDEANWGPKTQAYLQKVTAAYQGQGMTQAQPANDAFSAAFAPSSAGSSANDNDAFSAAFSSQPAAPKGVGGIRLATPQEVEEFSQSSPDAALAAKNQPANNGPSAPEGNASAALQIAQNHGYQPTGFDKALTAAEDFTEQAQRAASFGLTDKIGAVVPAINNLVARVLGYGPSISDLIENNGQAPTFSDTYHNALAQQRGYGETYAQNHPVASPIATAIGTIGSLGASGAATIPATFGGRVVQGAATGAGLGAVAGFGNSNDQSIGQTLADTGRGAVIGGVVGAALPVAAAGARAVAAPFAGNQTVANRLVSKFAGGTPAIGNASEIVPGSIPTLAEATGNANIAGLQRAARDINSQPFVEREQQNAAARNALFQNAAGTPQDVDAAIAAREQATASKRQAAFANAGEANPAYVNRAINRILKSPSGQRDVVTSALRDVQNKLFLDNPLPDRVSRAIAPIKDELASGAPMSAEREADLTEARRLLNSAARGNTSEDDLRKGLATLANKQKIVGPIDNALNIIKEGERKFQSDPAQLYGIRQAITDRLSPLAAGSGSDARLAARELGVIKKGLDSAIEKAAPGFSDYLKTYADMSRPIDQMKFLQGLNITDARGNITLQKVQNALRNVNKLQGAKGVNPAKSLTPVQIGALEAIRDDLLRAQNTSLGKSIGSPTMQNAINQMGLGKAALWAGKAIPAAVGTIAGSALGHIAGSPEIGGALGYPVGHVIGNAMGARSEAIRHELENLLLNPGALRVAGAGPRLPIVNAGNYLLAPSAARGSVDNKLLPPQ